VTPEADPDLPAAPQTGRWGRYGARPLLVLCLVGLVDAVDKGVLPGVLPQVQKELHLSDLQAGLLNTALIVATVLVAVPGGALSDRGDRRRMITRVLGLWSAATALAAGVQAYWQLLGLRAALGAGDALNDPASQSLVADYYPTAVRGRAYAFQRVAPTLGTGLGVGLGAALGAAFGWRVAVLAVAIPGVTVALLVHRLPLPPRGGHETPVEPHGQSTRQAVREVLRIPSLRALLLASSVIVGVLTALGFWGVTYHQRASGLSQGTAGGVVGGLILLGAVGGGILGGQATDRLRHRYDGWPMLLGAALTCGGALALTASFLDGIPVIWVRLPLQFLGAALIVAALPPLTVVTAEVVPPALRGTAFGLLKLFANLLAAATPPLIGLLADSHRIQVGQRLVGDLGYAFRVLTPLVLIGSVLLLRGRRRLDEDVARAAVPG
jgi:MFS family permease